MKDKKRISLFLFILMLAGGFLFHWCSWEDSSKSFSRFRREKRGAEIETDSGVAETEAESIDAIKHGGDKARKPAQTKGQSVMRTDGKKGPHDAFVSREKAQNFLRLRKLHEQRAHEQTSEADFTSLSGEAYSLEDGMLAVLATEENAGAFPGAALVSGHYIVQEGHAPRGLAVVKNSVTGRYAVFTGILKVKLASFEAADDVAYSVGAQVHREYEHIQTVFLRFEGYEETLSAKKRLEADSRVNRVEVELLEHQRQST